jgi:DNA-binding MarR family transcriptional regulator
MCLLTIHQKDNTTQQDLSEYLFLTKSGVTNAIRNLEKNNYITRTQSKKDGRQYTIKLTQKGEKIIPTLIEINQKWENTLELNKLDQRFLDDLTELANKSINLNL